MAAAPRWRRSCCAAVTAAVTESESAPPAPDHDRLTRVRRPEHRQPVGRLAGGRAGTSYRRGLAQRLAGRAELGLELLVALHERGDPVLQVEDAAHPLDADAGRGQRADLAQQLDVAVGVAAPAPARPAGGDQA